MFRLLVLFVTLTFWTTTLASANEEILPESGVWELILLNVYENCPADLPFADAWMPPIGSQHALTFSSLETLPHDLHTLVAAEEVRETPEIFPFFPGDIANQFEVVPRFQIGLEPFIYRYTVLSPSIIAINYYETLALSDCVLVMSYALRLVDAVDAVEAGAETGRVPAVMPAIAGIQADLSQWTVFADATELVLIFDDPAAPDGALCASDLSQGETWYFEADEAFVSAIQNGYGMTLSYVIRIASNFNSTYEDYDIELVIGNAFALQYNFNLPPSGDWTPYSVELREGVGWYDVDGMLDVDDPELFQQLLRDVSIVRIRGEYVVGADTECIANVSLR